MKTYYVLWTYAANYSPLIEVEAKNEKEAALKATHCFGVDFHNKANVFVFDHPPVLRRVRGETLP